MTIPDKIYRGTYSEVVKNYLYCSEWSH